MPRKRRQHVALKEHAVFISEESFGALRHSSVARRSSGCAVKSLQLSSRNSGADATQLLLTVSAEAPRLRSRWDRFSRLAPIGSYRENPPWLRNRPRRMDRQTARPTVRLEQWQLAAALPRDWRSECAR